MIKVKIIADSVYKGNRVTTFELEYPRYIHSELLTHRVFSRNCASSRAIPLNTMIELVMNNPVIPTWTKNQKGMQGTTLDPISKGKATDEWLHALSNAVDSVKKLQELGVHKQNANRLLEPFQHIKTILTGNDFDNFFHLRIAPDVQPEMCELAKKMKEVYDKHTPYELKDDEVHCPYFNSVSVYDSKTILTSVALCAQVSYRKENSEPETVKRIINMLLTAERLHASPFEHVCRPIGEHSEQLGNINGYRQLRHSVEHLSPSHKCYDGVLSFLNEKKVIEDVIAKKIIKTVE